MAANNNNRKKNQPDGRFLYYSAGLLALAVVLMFFLGRQMKAEETESLRNSVELEPISPLFDVDSLMMIDFGEVKESERHDYRGFTVFFNKKYRIPNAVVYELLGTETSGESSRNGLRFSSDSNFASSADPSDYTGSGYDRGHMAPAADMKWDDDAMAETFLMSNICPQDHSLNSGGWQKLEDKLRDWARRDSSLVIVTGPILSKGMKRIGKNRVAVPERFFKVVINPDRNNPRGIGFIYSNKQSKGGVEKYAVSIDRVEAVTGYDFFASLPDDIENPLESQCNYQQWNQR